MIKIENIVTPSPEYWKSVILGCRNAFNSWDKSDSGIVDEGNRSEFKIGEADLALMKKLAKAGSDHRKFARQIPVIMDVTAPFFLWKEADQYKVGTVTNSCSTMHTIHKKEFELSDFSYQHLFDDDSLGEAFLSSLKRTIADLNTARERYLETGDKKYWWQMIELLPTSYNQKRTWSMNYEVLYNIYQARKDHRLDDWKEFCQIIVREIPYFAEIFGIES